MLDFYTWFLFIPTGSVFSCQTPTANVFLFSQVELIFEMFLSFFYICFSACLLAWFIQYNKLFVSCVRCVYPSPQCLVVSA